MPELRPIVESRILECYPGGGLPLRHQDVQYAVIHWTSLAKRVPENPNPIQDGLLTGPLLAQAFRQNALLGTGKRVPYHVLILDDDKGTAQQLLPMSIRGSHARGYNRFSWAVAVVGEGRPPSPPQRERLVQILAAWLPANGGLRVKGHMELPGASADPNKSCPGPWINPTVLGDEAKRILPPSWRTWDTMFYRIWLESLGFRV